MLTRTYLANLAAGIVSDLVAAGFDVRDGDIYIAADDAARVYVVRRPAMTLEDRCDIEEAVLGTLLDWRSEWHALDGDVRETHAEMLAADRAA